MRENNSAAHQRLLRLFDDGSFCEFEPFRKSIGGEPVEAVTGWGSIGGVTAYAFAQNPDASGGAMSAAQADKLARIYDLAAKTGAPVVGIFDSKGARLPEGNHMLDAFGKLLLASNQISGVVPQISVVAGNCTGTSALVAVSSDLVIAEKSASFGIETDGSANSELAHIKAESVDEAIDTAVQLLSYLPSNNLSSPLDYFDDSGDIVAPSNDPVSFFDADSFVALSSQTGEDVTIGLARMDGISVGTVIYAAPVLTSEGCAKAARHLRFCDAFSLPVVSFVDAEKFSGLREASQLAHAYAEATTVKLAVITGAAYGAVYIATAGKNANSDLTLAWPSAVISPLHPVAGTLLMMKDKSDAAVKEYKDTVASAAKAAEDGAIDDIIEPAETRDALLRALTAFAGKRVSRLAKKHSNIQL